MMNFQPGDYKYNIMLIAEEMALERYDVEYNKLPEKLQMSIFNDASLQYSDWVQASAEARVEAEQERKFMEGE